MSFGLRIALLLLLAGWLMPVGADTATGQPPERAGAVDFDRDIQPLLAGRCLACHGAATAEAGLRLDQREAGLALLDSGSRAVVPGDPEASELLWRVRADDELERMPPEGPPLEPGQIELLRRWIADGAHWPAHWSYRPLHKPPVPPVPGAWQQHGARTPIDHFVLRRLADNQLTPSPPADRRTLLRRVYFDLIGLPPTPEQVDAFLSDPAPDAYERVVDRLLASPRYGERWARHWMDVVHYAETHGHDQDRPREHAWPYRDYLIRAWNQDKPYGQFVRDQVAGDVLAPDDPWSLVATGFLATGPWDESSLRDIREDTLDRQNARYLDRDDVVSTTMATFVSTTVHCARCHDHKFDPVSQAEYYGLQAVFAGIDKANRAYDPDPQVAARRRTLAHRKAQLPEWLQTRDAALLEPELQAEVARWEAEVAQSEGAWQVLQPAEVRSEQGATLTVQPDGSVLSSGPRPEKDVYTVVAHWEAAALGGLRLEVLADDSLPQGGPGRQDNGNLHLNQLVVTAAPRDDPSAAQPVTLENPRADFNQQGWTIEMALDGNPATAWGIHPEVGQPHQAVFALAGPLRHQAGTILTVRLEQTHGGGHLIGRLRLSACQTAVPTSDAGTLPPAISQTLAVPSGQRSPGQAAQLAAFYLEQQLDAELAALPSQQQVYCGTNQFEPDGSFRPAPGPRPIHILDRGDVSQPGPLAQPGALACVPELDGTFDLDQSAGEGQRRAALAHWLADPRNVLTWRSIANRLWHYHFGQGLVATPNDFGQMGQPPTHPELLDWLAVTLQQRDGSLKALQRLIVTSAVYRQASAQRPDCAAVDAGNRWLWRRNPRRLDAEAIRDAVLQVSGQLDPTMGGPSVRQFIQTPGVHVTPNVDYVNFDADDPANHRRSVYRFIFRTLPDPFMEALDCPDGSQLAPQRTASVTALQALAMLNDKLIVRHSRHLAARATDSADSLPGQIAVVYRLLFGRLPSDQETAAVAAYARQHGLDNTCRILLNSNEFVFID